jgi:hypothetical protein
LSAFGWNPAPSLTAAELSDEQRGKNHARRRE